jgi:hypothetical protein
LPTTVRMPKLARLNSKKTSMQLSNEEEEDYNLSLKI